MKLILEGRDIPRNDAGDPAFTSMIRTEPHGQGVKDVFTDDEVVELVNRALYQLEYQKNSHRKRAQEQRNLLTPVKEALKRLYPGVSFAKATQTQLEAAMKDVQDKS